MHDALSKLPNRTQFEERLVQAVAAALETGEKFAVVFLDLDRFKQINDCFGHHIGDLLLRTVSKRLQGCIRGGDSLARLGGDEFTMIIAGQNVEAAVRIVANKVIDELSAPFVLEGLTVSIGSSIGIALFPGDGNTAEMLTERADKAIYLSKQAGGNTYRLSGELE